MIQFLVKRISPLIALATALCLVNTAVAEPVTFTFADNATFTRNFGPIGNANVATQSGTVDDITLDLSGTGPNNSLVNNVTFRPDGLGVRDPNGSVLNNNERIVMSFSGPGFSQLILSSLFFTSLGSGDAFNLIVDDVTVMSLEGTSGDPTQEFTFENMRISGSVFEIEATAGGFRFSEITVFIPEPASVTLGFMAIAMVGGTLCLHRRRRLNG